jgi:hypothetical protein
MHPDSRIRHVVAYRVVCVLEMRNMAVRTVAGCVPSATWRDGRTPQGLMQGSGNDSIEFGMWKGSAIGTTGKKVRWNVSW